MKIGFSMDVKQSQKLHMTHELKQSIEILQMNSQEVELLIAEELNENPVLEAEWNDGIDWVKFAASVKENISSKKYEENEYYENEVNPNNFLKEQVSLYDHLRKEISGIELKEREHEIALYIIEHVDDKGYFSSDTAESAKALNVSQECLIDVLKKIQNIEPAGLLARNLKECLTLQLESEDKDRELLEEIIDKELETIAQKKFSLLQKKYNISEETLGEVLRKIRSLDPKPGKRFSEFDTQYILPDVIVEKNGMKIQVIENNHFPKLYISEFYQKMLSESANQEVQAFIKERLNKALQLIRNIEQRNDTIAKVAEQIVIVQKEFFETEKGTIRPMKLKDIAAATGFHESTISRTVNGKYMLTPRGVYELKYFFASSVKTDSGNEVSNKEIQEEIRKLIKKEDKKKPLTDQKICDILIEQGIKISRRTVAKYREGMNIQGSSLRKELK